MGSKIPRLALGAAAVLLGAGCTIVSTAPPNVPAQGLEYNVERPGADYRSFDLASPTPEVCRDTCATEPMCVAFTYVNPGVQSPNARCLLKNAAPQPVPNSCCVSGVKAGADAYQASPPPPAPAAPPPAPEPPPPPPPAPVVAPQPAPVGGHGLEPGVKRPGSDYRSFELPSPSPEMCRDACRNEPTCLAFTYVNPGVQSPNARCWLKNAVPQPVADACCVSGVKREHEHEHGGWQAPPPPPPAPPPAPVGRGLEPGTKRPGSDYRSFNLPSPNPELCRDACQNEPTCLAFTYVNPGVQSPAARCWLKNAVPQPVPDACCVSGVKHERGGWQASPPPPPPPPPAPAAPTLEPNTVRSSGDYRSFDLPSPTPFLCRDACAREPQCRAFTYVKPGVQSPNPRCWLKNTVPPPRPDACCVSGVK